MKLHKSCLIYSVLALFFIILIPVYSISGQEIKKPSVDVSVENPAFEKGKGPIVLFDEGHNNYHTYESGIQRYKAFGDVITNNGYVIVINKAKFTADVLRGHDILVISNAQVLPIGNMQPLRSAFTPEEIEAVHNWVKEGGSLLLIADHKPWGSAASEMAKIFGVIFSEGATVDPYDNNFYSRENGKLLSHPIVEGRNKREKLDEVKIFLGESLQAPEGSGFLKLSEKAYDLHPETKEKRPVPGHFQGAGFGYGKGRVVVLGEAAMLSFQVMTVVVKGKEKNKPEVAGHISFGLDPTKNKNKQFLLNMMHYLTGLLEPGVIISGENDSGLQDSASDYGEFDPTVENPAYEKDKGPVVLFDEGHNNMYTIPMYKAFVDVIVNDGYTVVANKTMFNKVVLKGCDILVISNALDKRNLKKWKLPHYPAFSQKEVNIVRNWVKKGGALFLIADKKPFGGAAFRLAEEFGVIMSKGTTFDPKGDIIFSKENDKLVDHSIVRGRNQKERIKKVETFTGQALQTPEGTGFLKLSEHAYDYDPAIREGKYPVPNQFQGTGFAYGKGRVVILGEASMVSVRYLGLPIQKKKGNTGFYQGMNKNNDNKQLLINIMHYLSGLIEPGVAVGKK